MMDKHGYRNYLITENPGPVFGNQYSVIGNQYSVIGMIGNWKQILDTGY